jgi:hypothetical protein
MRDRAGCRSRAGRAVTGTAVAPAAYGGSVDMPSAVVIARYAQWLLAESDPGDWSCPSIEQLAAARGEARAARAVPAGEAEARYLEGRGCRELTIPAAAVAGEGPPEPWAAFRDVGAELAQALGPPSSLGSHGLVGPWGLAAPSWGSPFLQWRRPQDRTLELRASERGADLVLYPTGPWRPGARTTTSGATGRPGALPSPAAKPHDGLCAIRFWNSFRNMGIRDPGRPLLAGVLPLAVNGHWGAGPGQVPAAAAGILSRQGQVTSQPSGSAAAARLLGR